MEAGAPRVLVKRDPATHRFFAPCPRGLAAPLADELTDLGAQDVKPADAGVAFRGPFDLVYQANLHSRIASRILWEVASGPYREENEANALATGKRSRPYFGVNRTL